MIFIYNFTISNHIFKSDEQTILFNTLNLFETFINSNSYCKIFYISKNHFKYIYNYDTNKFHCSDCNEFNEVDFYKYNNGIKIISKQKLKETDIINSNLLKNGLKMRF
jgi:hypothetical protein